MASDRFGGALLAEKAARTKDFVPLKTATLAKIASRTSGTPFRLTDRTHFRAVLARGTWDCGNTSNSAPQIEVGVAKVADGTL